MLENLQGTSNSLTLELRYQKHTVLLEPYRNRVYYITLYTECKFPGKGLKNKLQKLL